MENSETIYFNFFTALSEGDYKAKEKFLTDCVIKALIKYEGGLEEEIKANFEQTKDEAKRTFLLADYIRYEYLEFADADATKLHSIWHKETWDGKTLLRKDLGDLRFIFDLLFELTISVDCYEVAKALINRYKKQKGISNKKNKKKLTLLKKSA